MPSSNFNIQGLSDEQVLDSRKLHGENQLSQQEDTGFLHSIVSILKEPMIVLLLAAATIYFITGNLDDGIFMTLAIVLVATISLYQESKSRNALKALRTLTQPKSKVIRNGILTDVSSTDIVLGDFIVVEEGTSVPADGIILQANDFEVNESILTGESLPVIKNEAAEDKNVYQGTWVSGGLAICEVTAIGNQTKLGKIGKILESIEEEERRCSSKSTIS
jgi:Ca2+-transporting ATPase